MKRKQHLVDKRAFWINLNLRKFEGFKHRTEEDALNEAARLARNTGNKIYTLQSFAKTLPYFKELVVDDSEITYSEVGTPEDETVNRLSLVQMFTLILSDGLEGKNVEQICDLLDTKEFRDEVKELLRDYDSFKSIIAETAVKLAARKAKG